MRSRSHIRTLLLTLLLTLFSACTSETPRTQIMVVIDGDDQVIERASTLEVEVYGRKGDAAKWESVSFDETYRPLPKFPLRIALVPRAGDQGRQFRVTARAKDGSGYEVRAQVIGSFQKERTLAVNLYLDDRCAGVSCDALDETCRAGRCEDARVKPEDLSEYDAEKVKHRPGTEGPSERDAAADADTIQPDAEAPMSCIASTTRCENDVTIVCDADGKVASMEACALSCNPSGLACNACTPDSVKCETNELRVCGSDGTIVRSESCSEGCHPDGDRCQVSQCMANTKACVGSQLVVCDAQGKVSSNTVCDSGCNASAGACYACAPSSTLCDGSDLVTCNAQGSAATRKTCTLGCSGGRCLDVAPSNGLASELDSLSATDPMVTLTGAATINTDTGEVKNGNGSVITVPSSLVTLSNVTPARVFRVRSLQAENIKVTGERAIVVLSEGAIVITGLFDVSGDLNSGSEGPGARPETDSCTGVNSNYTNNGWGGAGGGGGISVGGRGGAGGGGAPSAGGAVHGNAELVPLRGGCRGGKITQNNSGELAPHGKAGGAVQLVSRASINISGNIDAGGSGAGVSGFGSPATLGGAGGGSGGGILLEAPEVVVSGLLASITANGGGGSAGGGPVGSNTCAGTPGADGRRDTMVALGGAQCSAAAGAGGAGGAGSTAPTLGSDGQTQGGGGGGAAGRIRVNTKTGFMVLNGAKVSPTASEGMIGTR